MSSKDEQREVRGLETAVDDDYRNLRGLLVLNNKMWRMSMRVKTQWLSEHGLREQRLI